MWELANLPEMKVDMVHVLEELTEQYNVLIGCEVFDRVYFPMRGRRRNWETTLVRGVYHEKLRTQRGKRRVEVVLPANCRDSRSVIRFYRYILQRGFSVTRKW